MKVRRVFILLFLMLTAVTLSYSNIFHGQFIMDDIGRIVDNGRLSSMGKVFEGPGSRCLVDLSFAFDYMLGGLNPAFFHLGNLAVHLACCLVLFFLTGRLAAVSGISRGNSEAAAFFTALLWGVHPLTTSAVTYICQRYEAMMSLFYLCSMWFMSLGAGQGVGYRKIYLALSVLSCVLGMMSKQIMITAPFVLLLMDIAFFSGGLKASLRKRWPYYAGLLFCWVVMGMIVALNKSDHSAIYGESSASQGALDYLLNQGAVIVHYLRLVIVPYPLTLDYAWLPLENVSSLMIPFAIVALLFISVTYGVLRWPRRFFAAFSFFIVLSPSSSLVPLPDLAFEHRMYLPLAGIVASMVLAGMKMAERRWQRSAVCAAAVIFSACLGFSTFRRNADYAEPERIWSGITERIPHNFRAWGFLIEAKLQKGSYLEAEQLARQMYARVQVAASDKSGRYMISSSSPEQYRVLSANLLGRALMAQGRPDDALACFSTAVRAYPDDAGSRHNMALALLALGRDREAEAELSRVLVSARGFKQAAVMKARIMIADGRHLEAADMLGAVLSEHPDFLPARVELAWLKAVSGEKAVYDPAAAEEIVSDVEAILGASGSRLKEIRAAILADGGDFSGAIMLQDAAVSESRRMHPEDSQSLAEMAGRLEAYKEGRPHRIASEGDGGKR